MKFLILIVLLTALFQTSIEAADNLVSQSINFIDENRNNRKIPVQLYYNRKISNKQLVIISPGYQIEKAAYSFLAEKLVEKGYTVASIQHDIPTDEPVASSGNLYQLRMPVWERGVRNIQFVTAEIVKKSPALDYQNLILIGHSMGGDISMLFARKFPEQVSAAISLDHRRMPIPRIFKPRLLSIRADEFPPDEGVLPAEDEQKQFGIKIVNLKKVKHNDLSNDGSLETKQKVSEIILDFLEKKTMSNFMPNSAKQIFSQLKTLVGEWQGKTDYGKVYTVSYKLMANDTVLAETWGTLGSTKTALTLYHLDGEKLIATHYCPLGNQPRLELVSRENQIFSFKFVSATNLPDINSAHQHQFDIQVKSSDEFWRSETYLEKGKAETEGVTYYRIKG